MAKIEVETPSTLTARASYEWREETDDYYWAIVVSFGNEVIATLPYEPNYKPDEDDIDEFMAARLKGLFV